MYSKGVAYMCGGNVPFIRLFKGHSGYYAYDVNTNQLLRISKDLFNYLKVLLREKSASENPLISDELQLLQKKGYLSSHFPDHIKRLDADDLEYYLNHRMSELIIQVTQSCNFACQYCKYSYDTTGLNHHHNNLYMTWETAQRCIDFLQKELEILVL